jgi:hypothetical protein
MKIKLTVCTLLILLITVSVQAAVNQPIVAMPKAKAFYLDTTIWPINPATQTYDIPICWENLSAIKLRGDWSDRRFATVFYLNKSWQAVSRLKFYEAKPAQCPPLSSNFSGVRVLVDPNKGIYIPAKKITLLPPYVTALGNKLKNRPNGVVLNFDIGWSKVYLGCLSHGYTPEGCFKASVIHEFGHVIGMSHEQNRNDAVPGIHDCNLKIQRDPLVLPPQFGSTAIGNIKIGGYDEASIMNYCNPKHPGISALSYWDKIAANVYYGNMPSVLSPPRHTGTIGHGIRTFVIPSVLESGAYYRYVFKETNQDLSPKNNIIDNVYTYTRTKLFSVQVPSAYPATFNSLTKTISIPLFKRVLNNVEVTNPNNGQVTSMGKTTMVHNRNGTYTMGTVTLFPGVYPIARQ